MALLVFVAFDDVRALDRADAGHDQLLPHPFAGRPVDLVEMHSRLLGRGGVKPHADGDERELQKPGPIRAGGGCHRDYSWAWRVQNSTGSRRWLFPPSPQPVERPTESDITTLLLQVMTLPLDMNTPPMEARPVPELPSGDKVSLLEVATRHPSPHQVPD